MPHPLEDRLARWQQAGLLDAAAADRIRQYEGQQAATLRWPVLLALGAGGLMVSAGVLLFVAAHWADLTPSARLILLVSLTGASHLAGAALADRFPALAVTLHACGTAALGAGIFLVGQSYHLELSWPRGFLLWSLGAGAGLLLLRQWPQALFLALLAPAWLVSEWTVVAQRASRADASAPAGFVLLLAITYLLAEGGTRRGPVRATLAIVGSLALLPAAALALIGVSEIGWRWGEPALPRFFEPATWLLAIGLPLALAVGLRGREAWPALIAAAWVVAGLSLPEHPGAIGYLWLAIGALLLTASGAQESRRIRINLGMGGFALTVLVFYFSSVLDKLGRSASLLAGGVLFLVLGWGVERLRRRLVAGTRRGGGA